MFIRKSALMVLVALLSPALLQGCAQVPQRAAGNTVGVSNTAQTEPELNNLSQGDLVQLYSGLLAPFGKVMIGREYYSASGRLCKQIMNVTGEGLVSIVCSLGGDRWYVRKPLGGAQDIVSGSASYDKPLVPASIVKTEK